MNSHAKRWMDDIINSLKSGEQINAALMKDKLIFSKGTKYLLHTNAISWYLSSHLKLSKLPKSNNITIYMKV